MYICIKLIKNKHIETPKHNILTSIIIFMPLTLVSKFCIRPFKYVSRLCIFAYSISTSLSIDRSRPIDVESLPASGVVRERPCKIDELASHQLKYFHCRCAQKNYNLLGFSLDSDIFTAAFFPYLHDLFLNIPKPPLMLLAKLELPFMHVDCKRIVCDCLIM